jgi:hypothetical protein
MTPLQIQAKIQEGEAKLRDMQAALKKERTAIKVAIGNLKTKAKPDKGKVEFLEKRIDSYGKQGDELIAAKNQQIALLNEALTDKYEKMHGLLSYALANCGISGEAKLLHDSLGDFINAKNERDRNDAGRTISLCFEHGNMFADKPDVGILEGFESLEGEQAAIFYKKHQAEITKQQQARIDAAKKD